MAKVVALYAATAAIATGIPPKALASNALDCKKAAVASMYAAIDSWSLGDPSTNEQSKTLATTALECSQHFGEPERSHYAFIAARAQLVASKSANTSEDIVGFASFAYTLFSFVKNDTMANVDERSAASRILIESHDYFQSLGLLRGDRTNA